MDFGTFAIAGIPLIIVVFAIVEEIKVYGLTGKVLRGVSLLVGVVLALAYQLTMVGLPGDSGGWFTTIVVGLLYGLTASGAYDFMDARFPPK